MRGRILCVAFGVLVGCGGTLFLAWGLRPVEADCRAEPCESPPCCNGDVNGDGTIDLADAVGLLTYLFEAGPAPVPWQGSAAEQTAGFLASGLRADFPGARGIVCPDCDDEERFDVLEIAGGVVVVDFCTGLMWQQVPREDALNFTAAVNYCNGLTLAGESDWRMPTLRELLEIVDYDRWNPAISWFFRGSSTRYWVDEPFAYSSLNMHWAVDFLYGEVTFTSPEGRYMVRAVRDIQEGDLP